MPTSGCRESKEGSAVGWVASTSGKTAVLIREEIESGALIWCQISGALTCTVDPVEVLCTTPLFLSGYSMLTPKKITPLPIGRVEFSGIGLLLHTAFDRIIHPVTCFRFAVDDSRKEGRVRRFHFICYIIYIDLCISRISGSLCLYDGSAVGDVERWLSCNSVASSLCRGRRGCFCCCQG